MIIRKRVKLGNNNYYIEFNCEYKMKDNYPHLCLKNYADDYYDGGDLSKLIKLIEKNYCKEICQKYNKNITFLSECLYIYDNIPFLSGIGDFYISSDGLINSSLYITKDELDKCIKENYIEMKNLENFKLSDERTWNIS